MSCDSDDDLLQRAAGGDHRAQAELLARYRVRLRRMIEMRLDRRLGARADPSDIVQETMKTALVRLPDYFADPRISFYPWLRRIAADRLADAYRMHVAAERRSVLKEHPWMPISMTNRLLNSHRAL
jgi:RNA polymerase sigma-70 factor (ECF subfamily)